MNARADLVGILAALLLLGSASVHDTVLAADSPNVLFIICDDLNDTVQAHAVCPLVKSGKIYLSAVGARRGEAGSIRVSLHKQTS